VIVAAHHADDRLWMEVLNLGGYNVLAKPLLEQEVFRMISNAWLHRNDATHSGASASSSS
jgi:FixJ family two-component response regulator